MCAQWKGLKFDELIIFAFKKSTEFSDDPASSWRALLHINNMISCIDGIELIKLISVLRLINVNYFRREMIKGKP